ncbi:PTS system, lactose/cellobiose family IIC component [Enterococcus phoeniculicola]|jgi:PTS system cellobiose-specific IIC component|uniref:Permease IIC component n=1 Tax=Enterococcus phoeniculicola ATCC BAA-412 TaxID=1158610 RepID=R3TJH9_9ENTE|nr:PTS transporter subunit EIIC [Enterococcus phoeniculicola]EOL41549.1 PTS system, lactose/cellobiose family IIC component [Enterococcus phoeniculicola ATCC BAA-412]EOT78957.1 hypothetical protein I589_00464 [Enterococcus phoeniculicola ATCC BAA-412]OJG70676.1 PTS system, lactose/cellobiose family IIC component [Enterococcus phoeniculicola]
MKKIMKWLEETFQPKMNKFANNRWVSSLKDTINQIMPLIFLGSIFAVLTLPSEIKGFEWFANFWTPFGWTMGVIGMMIAFLLPMILMEKFRMRGSRFVAAIAGMILYAMIISPQLVKDGVVGFSHDSFGSSGMFISMISGFFVAFIFKTLRKISFFKEDTSLPDFVRTWFDQMLPVGLIVIFGWVLIFIFNFDLYLAIQSIFVPLKSVMSNIWGFTLVNFIVVFLYSLGISGWILFPITAPVYLQNIELNINEGAQMFATQSFDYAYLKIGGLACTLGLVILMLTMKSKKLTSLGRASIVPSIFNINEPIVFGAIAFNPMLMIPMWINSVVVPLLAWFLTIVIPFGKIPDIQFNLWYIPYPILTWLATGGHLGSVALAVIIFVVSTLIWYPFLRVYDNQCIREEAEEA